MTAVVATLSINLHSTAVENAPLRDALDAEFRKRGIALEGLAVTTSSQCRGVLIRFVVPSVRKYFNTIIDGPIANAGGVEQLAEHLIECVVAVAEPFKAELLKRWGFA